jgi:LysM repeat protein
MTEQDETRRREAGGGETPPAGPGGPAPSDPDDALRSLERLETLAKGETLAAAAPVSPPPRRLKRPRLASAPRPAQGWARIAAPAAFLVAVIVVVSLAFQSGVVGGDGEKKVAKPIPKGRKSATKSPRPSSSAKPSAKPTTTPTATGATRSYTVKPGDTLSGIAARFDTSVAEIERLNPDADLTTLQPGQKLIVPAQ